MSRSLFADGRRRGPTVWRLPAAIEALLGPRLPHRPACAGRAPEFDDQLPGETPDDRDRRVRAAAAVCADCPARHACAVAATDLGREASGVWAGQLLNRPPARAAGRRPGTTA
jgi:hypothetical protein